MRTQRLQILMETAIMAAIAFVLELIPLNFGWVEINLGIVAIFILALRRGWKAGMVGGFIWGILRAVSGTATILSPLQAILEYLFAFMLAGLIGIWSTSVQKDLYEENQAGVIRKTFIGSLFSMFVEYFVHFLAGVAFWSSYAPEGMGAVTYSLIVNGLSGFATWLVNWLILIFLIRTNRRVVLVRN